MSKVAERINKRRCWEVEKKYKRAIFLIFGIPPPDNCLLGRLKSINITGGWKPDAGALTVAHLFPLPPSPPIPEAVCPFPPFLNFPNIQDRHAPYD